MTNTLRNIDGHIVNSTSTAPSAGERMQTAISAALFKLFAPAPVQLAKEIAPKHCPVLDHKGAILYHKF